MAYPPEVERWRSLVERYFRPEDVDKALYVIQHESGGNPTIKASVPSEQSYGLFQANIGGGIGTGYTVEQLKDPETNVKIAAQAVYGGSGWSPWGEGVTYKGQKFGALGNNPYTPSSGSGRGFTAPPPPGGTQMATPQQEEYARRLNNGKSYDELTGNQKIAVDSVVKSLFGADGLTPPKSETPKLTYVGRLAYVEYPDGRRERSAVDDLPQEPAGASSVTAGGTSEPSRSIRVNQDTGKAYVVDNQGNTVREAPEFNERPGGETRPQGAISTDDLLAAGGAIESPGIYVARNGQRYIQNPDKTWSPSGTPSTTAEKKSAGLQIAEQRGRIQSTLAGGSGTQASAPSGASAPARTEWGTLPDGSPAYFEGGGGAQAPVLQGNGQNYYSQTREIKGPTSALGQPGEAVAYEIPTPGGGGSAQYHVGTAQQDLRAAGIIPSGNNQKDLDAGNAAVAKRALMLDEYKDPLVVQSMFDTLNRGTDVYSRAKAVAAEEAAAKAAYSGGRLPAAGTDQLTAAGLRDFLTPENVQSYLPDDYEFAEGGTLTVGTDDDKTRQTTMPGMDSMEAPVPGSRMTDVNNAFARQAGTGPRYTHNGNIQRVIDGQKMTMPATGGNFVPSERFGMSGWQEQYDKDLWGGARPATGSINQAIYQVLFPRWLQGTRRIKDMPGSGAWDWNGTDANSASIGGQTYRFANGGSMMLNEPVVGMGMESGQPKFLAGEAGPEQLDFTPAGPPMPGGAPMGALSPMPPMMQPPVPQGRTDPRLLSMFAMNAASKMRPMTAIPGA